MHILSDPADDVVAGRHRRAYVHVHMRASRASGGTGWKGRRVRLADYQPRRAAVKQKAVFGPLQAIAEKMPS
jgi:hypothetical protein